MFSSKTPYELYKDDNGDISVVFDPQLDSHHIPSEGIQQTTNEISDKSRQAMIVQISDDLKNNTPFIRFKREMLLQSKKSATTILVGFLSMWTAFQLFLAPILFNIPVSSTEWNAVFVLSSENIEYVWTWVTNVLSHGGLIHLIVNSIVILSFGYYIEEEIKPAKYLSLFFASAIIASVIQVLLVSTFSSDPMRVLGASGGAIALLGCATVFHPKMKIALFFFIPIDLWKGMIIFLVGSTSIVAIFGFGAWNIAHIAHIIGFLCGFTYGFYHKEKYGLTETFIL